MSNRGEFIEVQAATLRGGFRITPINWHLTTDEIAYILNDCEAQAVFAEARIAASAPAAAQAPGLKLKVSAGGGIDGFQAAGEFIPLGDLAGEHRGHGDARRRRSVGRLGIGLGAGGGQSRRQQHQHKQVADSNCVHAP